MKTEIRYTRLTSINGRAVAYAQLFDEDGNKIFPARTVDVPLAQILQHVKDSEGLEIMNAHDILNLIILTYGFAS